MAATEGDERTSAVLARLARPAFALSLVVKSAIGVLGVAALVVPGDDAEVDLLLAWCVLGTAYMAAVVVALALASRVPVSDRPPAIAEMSVAARVTSVLLALVGVVVGLSAAVQHTLIDRTSPDGYAANLVGIWAMVLAWMLLHWGFAQTYLQQYYRVPGSPTLQFPHDGKPGTIEFAYFAYGVAVSLAVSDVVVRASRARALVLLHSVLAFFFNGLIIVTALAALGEVFALR